MSEDTPQWIVTVTNPSIAPRDYTLKVGKNLVGRSAGSDVFVDDASASRLHAEICWDPLQNSVTLFDLDSTNGTFVNQGRLTAARELSPGDIIRIGECLLTVNLQGRLITQDLLVQSVGRHARLLYDVSYKFNTILDIDTALSEVANLMSSSMRADKCMVILAEHFDRLNELGFPTSIAQQAIQQKAAILIPVVTPDTTHIGKSAQLLSVRSALCVPVLAGDNVLALVYAYKSDPLAQPFTQVDSEVAVAISHQAALTLQRTTLIKQAQQVLRDSEQRIRAVMSSSPDIIFTVDARTFRPTLLNRNDFFGYLMEEFGTANVHLLSVHAADASAVRADWEKLAQQTVEDNPVTSIEYRLYAKNGTCEWVQSRNSIFEFGPDGRPTQILVTLTVITEHKQAQERLRESEAMLADAQRLAHLGNWEWHIGDNRMTGSKEFYRMYSAEGSQAGATPREIMDRIHPLDRLRVLRAIRQALRSRQPFAFSHRRVLPDDEVRIYQIHGWVVLNDTDNPVRLYGTAQDVTEIHQVERALKRRSDELATLNSIVTTLNSSRNISAILASTLDRIVMLLAADGAVCHILDDNDALKLGAQYGLGPHLRADSSQPTAPVDVKIKMETIASQAPVQVVDVKTDPRYQPSDLARTAGYRSALYLPIMGHDRPLGTFTLYTREARTIDQEMLNLLGAVGTELGVAIERINLYEAQRKRTEQLTRSSALITALSHVTARLQATLDPDSVIETLGAELKALRVSCFIFLANSQTEDLVLHYTSLDGPMLARLESSVSFKLRGAHLSPTLFPFYDSLVRQRQALYLPETATLATAISGALPKAVANQALELVRSLPGASLMYLPLVAEDRVLGILAVVELGLKKDDVPAFSAFGGQVAVAIENARLFEEVRTGRERLGKLAKQVISAQEDERRRVARELHDEAGQALTALKIELELIRNDLPAEFGGLRERLNEATSLVDSTLQEIRLLAQALRPASLDALHNINLTLEVFCREFRRRTQLAINYAGAELPTLSEEANVCLYRFLQEALTNVAKHSRARRIWVVLQREGDDVRLSVEDDGIGLQPGREMGSVAPLGIGMLGMQERLELLGGRLEVDSQSGEGTRVIAHLPNVLKELDTREVA